MQKTISNIVFTKNRPLQLDAYLESLYKYFPSQPIRTYVIYKEELFTQEYELLFSKFKQCIVVRESDFHSDFMNILNRIDTDYILFGVDDVVFFDSVNFDVINEIFDKGENDIFGFSLRFGDEITGNGKDIVNQTEVRGQTVFYLDWTKGQTPNTRYPFELCATIYKTSLVKEIIAKAMSGNAVIRRLFLPNSVLIKTLGKITSMRSTLKSFGFFFNPNTLESWNCRWCREHNDQFPKHIYFQKLCASAVQLNMVNATMRKVFDESDGYTIESLAQKYRQGYRLDINYISENKPRQTHCGKQCFRLCKDE
ncbi:MAG: hypothetical protein P8016_15435 [Sedimentisphaerales bacterium]